MSPPSKPQIPALQDTKHGILSLLQIHGEHVVYERGSNSDENLQPHQKTVIMKLTSIGAILLMLHLITHETMQCRTHSTPYKHRTQQQLSRITMPNRNSLQSTMICPRPTIWILVLKFAHNFSCRKSQQQVPTVLLSVIMPPELMKDCVLGYCPLHSNEAIWLLHVRKFR